MYPINESSTIALTVILTVFATIAVSIRLLQRKRSDKIQMAATSINLGSQIDDVFCLFAWLFVIPTSAIIIWGASKGAIGSHSALEDSQLWIVNVNPQLVILNQVVWSVLFLQPLALGFIKLSALFFYRRIFMGTTFNVVSWMVIGIVSVWMTFFSISLFFDCGADVATNWKSPAEISKKCWFGFLPTIIYTILDACLDLIVLMIPVPFIFALQMPLSKKISVCACLMLGGLATSAAFIRMAIFIQSGIPSAALDKNYIMGLPTFDVVGIVSAEMFWTIIETTIALIAICLPAVRKFISVSGWDRGSGSFPFFSRFFGGRQSEVFQIISGPTDFRKLDVELGNGKSSDNLVYSMHTIEPRDSDRDSRSSSSVRR